VRPVILKFSDEGRDDERQTVSIFVVILTVLGSVGVFLGFLLTRTHVTSSQLISSYDDYVNLVNEYPTYTIDCPCTNGYKLKDFFADIEGAGDLFFYE